jgi:dihydroneopterin aldolase
MQETMTIELTGLRFFAYHGWHEEESKTGNQFEVAIQIFTAVSQPIHSIDQTVNYVRAYELVKTEMEQPQKLLETLVQRIAVRIGEEFAAVQKLVISIKKLTAPIPHFTGSVGVTYTKEF